MNQFIKKFPLWAFLENLAFVAMLGCAGGTFYNLFEHGPDSQQVKAYGCGLLVAFFLMVIFMSVRNRKTWTNVIPICAIFGALAVIVIMRYFYITT